MKNTDSKENDAVISPDGKYRYKLTRSLGKSELSAAFILLNPSTADDTEDDQTVKRCTYFARKFGFGRIAVYNLFAYRATLPMDLFGYEEPIGPENDKYLLESVRYDKIIAAWGDHGNHLGRDKIVLNLLKYTKIFCLGKTKSGSPRHPLYLSKNTELVPFNF